MPPSKQKDGGESTKSTRSLVSKAGATMKAIKRKATEILSPRKKKKAIRVPHSEGCDQASTNSDSQSASEVSSQCSNMRSVIEVPDEESSDEELRK